jgi:hypothetical protein
MRPPSTACAEHMLARGSTTRKYDVVTLEDMVLFPYYRRECKLLRVQLLFVCLANLLHGDLFTHATAAKSLGPVSRTKGGTCD